ncbi:divalent-cation tolerance protein CutA [Streptomyces sp. NPDC059863]|uniref:divalent-cation tolerance protein CutA n=1 Tax=unclassified Streptomyces TaxID=2593676 RepID=UPI00364A7459
MIDLVQVSTATETREQAILLAQSVVRARLAAGVQIIGPVTSVFWHLGEFGTGEEWQLLMKTRADRYPALEAHLLEHHPWDSPEVSAVPIVAGSETCLRWVASSTEPE